MSDDKIPQDPSPVNKINSETPAEEPHLTAALEHAFQFLEYKFLYWQDKGGLQKDGSFYLTNPDFGNGIKRKVREICYLKKKLRDLGKIKYYVKRGYKGTTYYTIIQKAKKQGSAVPPAPPEEVVLDPVAVRIEAKMFDKEHAIKTYTKLGFTEEQIRTCFTD